MPMKSLWNESSHLLVATIRVKFTHRTKSNTRPSTSFEPCLGDIQALPEMSHSSAITLPHILHKGSLHQNPYRLEPEACDGFMRTEEPQNLWLCSSSHLNTQHNWPIGCNSNCRGDEEDRFHHPLCLLPVSSPNAIYLHSSDRVLVKWISPQELIVLFPHLPCMVVGMPMCRHKIKITFD